MQHIGKNLLSLDLSGTVNSSLTDEGIKSIVKYCRCLEDMDFSMCRSLTLQTLIPLLHNPDTAVLVKKLLISTKKVCTMIFSQFFNYCSVFMPQECSNLKFGASCYTLYSLSQKFLHSKILAPIKTKFWENLYIHSGNLSLILLKNSNFLFLNYGNLFIKRKFFFHFCYNSKTFVLTY